jgi:MFS family permease
MDQRSDGEHQETDPLLQRTNRDEPHAQSAQVTSIQYSAFTKSQKWGITFLVALVASFSPLSSFIYYPALSSIANDLQVSLHMVDLTITSYMIVSAVAPSIMGDIADRVGRRPVFLLMLTIYVAANVGLAAQRSFAALFMLRMLQSAGSSGMHRPIILSPHSYFQEPSQVRTPS